MATVTHHTALPDTAQKTDFYAVTDSATVSAIVDADIASGAAIADTKLATIRTAGKVGGAALTELANIPAGAGSIPVANISSLTNTQIDASAAIADTKLAQIATASKVSGAALTSLSSIPGAAGQIPVANLGTGTGSSSNYLRGDGSWYALSATSQLFTSSGTFTAPTGVTKILVTMVAGGGGGGRGDSGGYGNSAGAGGYTIKWPVSVTPGNNYSVTVGNGGNGRTTSIGTGDTGGSSVFPGDDITITCTGGVGGHNSSTDSYGSAGGSGSTYGAGFNGINATAGSAAAGTGGYFSGGNGGNSYGAEMSTGGGGGSPFGVGADGVRGLGGTVAGNNATIGYGGGGSGSVRNANGGNGASGFVYIEW